MIKKHLTVGKNKKGFSERQYNRALAARKIYHMIGAQTLKILNMMIRQIVINNLPITVGDIDKDENIFGPDVSTLKGRIMIQRKKVIVDFFIEITIELIGNNQQLILYIDIMFINKQALLPKIDKYIWFIGLVPLSNRTKEECYRDLGVIMRHYNKSIILR